MVRVSNIGWYFKVVIVISREAFIVEYLGDRNSLNQYEESPERENLVCSNEVNQRGQSLFRSSNSLKHKRNHCFLYGITHSGA